MPPDLISPEELEKDRARHLVDLRPWSERHSPLGYLPGSRSFGWTPQSAAQLQHDYADRPPLALVCASGRRSQRLLDAVRLLGFADVRSLRGGVLGWREQGLPTCGVEAMEASEIPHLNSPERFPRVLLACFVAETVENRLGASEPGDLFDPAAAVRALVARELEGASPDIDSLVRLLDRTAELARQRGYPTQRIAMNVDRLVAALRRLECATHQTLR